jgi:PAS domain S-box-containing protein
MGDARFTAHYDRVRSAMDHAGELDGMTDDEIVQALGAASRERDPYLANVLTTAVLNRTRRGRAVIENIGEGVCIVDRKGIVTSANPAAGEILGWTMSELQGTYFHAIVHHHRGRYHEQSDDCSLGGALTAPAAVARMEDSFSRRDGTRVDVKWTISSIVVDGVPDASVVLFQDIGESKRAQSLLVEQTRVLESAITKTLAELAERERVERRFSAILSALPDAVVMTDASGVITLASDETRRMFGYAREELVGELAAILLPERYRSLGSPGAPLASQTDPSARIELVGRRKDGTEFPLEMTASALDDAGKPAFLTSIREIGARRIREEKLRHSELMLKDAEALGSVGSWELDLASGRLSWSDEMYRLCGFAPREVDMTWETFLSIVHPEDRPGVEAALAGVRAGRGAPLAIQHRILLPDGPAKALRGRMLALPREGEATRVLGSACEPDHEGDAHAALETAARRLAALLDALPVGVVVLAADGSVSLSNAKARERGALTPEGALCAPLQAHVDQLAAQVALPGASRLALPVRDEAAEAIVGVQLLRDVASVETLITVEDPAALDAVEGRLRDATDSLERKVAERTAALARGYRELEAFSYTVSHDLQAPLRALEFFLATALEDHAQKGGKLRSDLERMSAEVKRLRSFIKAALQLATLGVREAKPARIDLSGLAQRVADDLTRSFPQRRVVVSIEPDMVADADPAMLQTLLENLLSNAWKYSTARDPAHVEIGMRPGAPPTFCVRDDGEGFDMRYASRLFQPFSRLASSGKHEGSGVGLASARRVVEEHGGRIWAESAPGEGATFWFTLAPDPRSFAPAEPATLRPGLG